MTLISQNQRSLFGTICILGLITLLNSSCALSPQQISIQPKIKVEPRDYGHQQTLIVQTIDARNNDILGVRGGVYKDTSVIQLENAFSQSVTREAIKALTSWGFDSIETSSQKLPTFSISIQDINYQSNDRAVANKINATIKASLKVEWAQIQYKGSYSASKSQTFVKAPSDASNTHLVNDLTSAVLQEIFDDPGLVTFLQKQAADNPL